MSMYNTEREGERERLTVALAANILSLSLSKLRIFSSELRNFLVKSSISLVFNAAVS